MVLFVFIGKMFFTKLNPLSIDQDKSHRIDVSGGGDLTALIHIMTKAEYLVKWDLTPLTFTYTRWSIYYTSLL